MKRLFTFISISVISIFFVWIIGERAQAIRYAHYPSIHVETVPNSSIDEHERTRNALNHLAQTHDSTIARRISKLNEHNKISYVYEVYGDKLPSGFVAATPQEANESDLANAYLIVDGRLTLTQLKQTLHNLNYKTLEFSAKSNLNYVIAIALSNSLILVSIVIVITFISITIIYRIKELRQIGIKLIAGEKLTKLLFNTILFDGIEIGIAGLTGFSIGYILLILNHLNELPFISLLSTAITFYCTLLLVLSTTLSLVYLFGLKNSGLMAIIKGKLPIKRLLAILMIGQLLAVTTVGFSFNRIVIYQQLLEQQLQSDKEWDKHTNWFNLSFYLSKPANPTDALEKNTRWFHFLNDTITHHNALLVKNNIANFVFSSPETEGLTPDSYDPRANTLYVTPNYFDVLSLPLDNATKDKLKQLKAGQFGLILPESLKAQTEHYKTLYTTYMTNLSVDYGETPSTTFEAVLGYLPNGQKQFLFNTSALSTQQYLQDAIIVVITPQSTMVSPDTTTGYTYLWKNALDKNLYLSDYQETINLLKKHDTYHWVTHIKNSRALYYEQVENIKFDTIMALIGAFLGVLTSLILFNAMNLLYFEQFRRDIFIKRIAGMTFIELHQTYLMTQFTVIFVGFIAVQFLTGNIAISTLSLLIFGANALTTLYYQSKKEERTDITVLKGK